MQERINLKHFQVIGAPNGKFTGECLNGEDEPRPFEKLLLEYAAVKDKEAIIKACNAQLEDRKYDVELDALESAVALIRKSSAPEMEAEMKKHFGQFSKKTTGAKKAKELRRHIENNLLASHLLKEEAVCETELLMSKYLEKLSQCKPSEPAPDYGEIKKLPFFMDNRIFEAMSAPSDKTIEKLYKKFDEIDALLKHCDASKQGINAESTLTKTEKNHPTPVKTERQVMKREIAGPVSTLDAADQAKLEDMGVRTVDELRLKKFEIARKICNKLGHVTTELLEQYPILSLEGLEKCRYEIMESQTHNIQEVSYESFSPMKKVLEEMPDVPMMGSTISDSAVIAHAKDLLSEAVHQRPSMMNRERHFVVNRLKRQIMVKVPIREEICWDLISAKSIQSETIDYINAKTRLNLKPAPKEQIEISCAITHTFDAKENVSATITNDKLVIPDGYEATSLTAQVEVLGAAGEHRYFNLLVNGESIDTIDAADIKDKVLVTGSGHCSSINANICIRCRRTKAALEQWQLEVMKKLQETEAVERPQNINLPEDCIDRDNSFVDAEGNNFYLALKRENIMDALCNLKSDVVSGKVKCAFRPDFSIPTEASESADGVYPSKENAGGGPCQLIQFSLASTHTHL